METLRAAGVADVDLDDGYRWAEQAVTIRLSRERGVLEVLRAGRVAPQCQVLGNPVRPRFACTVLILYLR